MLHFDPDVRNSQLYLAPEVPDWIGRLTLRDVPLMGGHLSIEVEENRCNVVERPDGLTLVPRPSPHAL
jgi:hypothetical protein